MTQIFHSRLRANLVTVSDRNRKGQDIGANVHPIPTSSMALYNDFYHQFKRLLTLKNSLR